jgi:hypothetical protein
MGERAIAFCHIRPVAPSPRRPVSPYFFTSTE